MNAHYPLAESVYFCLVGPAGSGKNSVVDALIERSPEKIARVITSTTRLPRPGEVDGESYHFLSVSQFQEAIDRGDFFEWEETHGNLYGTTIESIRSVEGSGQSPLLIVDIRGALTFKNRFPNRVVILFLTPSSRQSLIHRVVKRGTSQEELDIRLKTAAREYDQLLADTASVDYLVLNDVLDEAVARVMAVIDAECSRVSRLDLSVLQE